MNLLKASEEGSISRLSEPILTMEEQGGGSETHVDRVRGASSSQPQKQANKERGENQTQDQQAAEWQQIKCDLIDIKEGLLKEVENNGGTVEVGENLIKQLNRIIARVPHASRT